MRFRNLSTNRCLAASNAAWTKITLPPLGLIGRQIVDLRFPVYDAPPGFRQASPPLGVQASSDGRPARCGGNSLLLDVEGVCQQLNQSRFGAFSISHLRALASSYDAKSPIARQAVAPTQTDPALLSTCEQRAGLEFKKQHHLGRDFVHMLPAWSGASCESNFQPGAQLFDLWRRKICCGHDAKSPLLPDGTLVRRSTTTPAPAMHRFERRIAVTRRVQSHCRLRRIRSRTRACLPTSDHGHGVAIRSRRHAQGRFQRVTRRWLCGRRLKHESENGSEENRTHKEKPHKLSHD